MVRLVTGGGSDLSPDMQKIVAKLEQLLKGGKKLDIGIDELKKKAGVFNVKNATVSAYINRKKKEGKFKNLTIKSFGGGIEIGTSKYDKNFKDSKKFSSKKKLRETAEYIKDAFGYDAEFIYMFEESTHPLDGGEGIWYVYDVYGDEDGWVKLSDALNG